jgi:YbbR domain-containing protein
MSKTRDLPILRSRVIQWIAAFLLIAAVLFIIWPVPSSDETDIFVPVDPGRIPRGLTASDLPSKGIEVRVRGPKSVIENLSKLELRYKLDLTDAKIGVKVIPVKEDRIPLPKEASVVSAHPPILRVRIAREINKQIPVIISLLGKPASGFFVSDAIAQPPSVIIRGPEHVLAPIEKAPSKPIDVKGLAESFKKPIALDLPEGLQIVAPSGVILGKIVISEKIVIRKFKGIPVEGKNTSYAFSVTPPAIEIEIEGPVDILEKLHVENGIRVFVDLKDLKPGVYVRRAAITLPSKAALVWVNPKIFTVKIKN